MNQEDAALLRALIAEHRVLPFASGRLVAGFAQTVNLKPAALQRLVGPRGDGETEQEPP